MARRRPDHLKLIAGTARPDRRAPAPRVTLAPLEELPAPPEYLPNAHATREWQRLGPVLVAQQLLNAGNVSAFAVLCGLHGRIVQLWNAGEAPQAALVSQYRALLGDFGLTLMQRQKSDPVPAKANRFSAHGRKSEKEK